MPKPRKIAVCTVVTISTPEPDFLYEGDNEHGTGNEGHGIFV